MFLVIFTRPRNTNVQRLGFMLGFDVEPDRDLGRGLGLDLRLLSALCRCICKFAVARFTFV